jgi:zinc protease
MALVAGLVHSPLAVHAAPLPAGMVAGPSVEGIQSYTLANGMTVLLFPDASKATVTVNVTYRVGSLQENYGETGMAHLLEHLLFKGTPSHADIPAEMKKRGMSYNASTALDRTNYFATFPADEAQLEWLLQLEADRMVNSFVAKKDLDSEMTVVRNEMEAGANNPGNVLVQRMLSTAYLWHHYGNSTIGARSDVENVNIERLQDFYRTWYQPDNAVVLVAGRIDPAKALQAIQASLGKVKRPSRVLPAFYTVEPIQDGEREVVVRRSGDVKLAALAYHIPSAAHPDTAALSVLVKVLGDTPSGRLHKTLVEGKQAAGVGAFNFEQRDPGAVLLFAQLPLQSDAEAVSRILIDQTEGLAAHPVTEEEVGRAKVGLLKDIELALNDPNRVGLALSEPIGAGDWRLLFLNRDRVEKVTAEDVNRVARAYLKPSNRTLGLFLPDAKPDRAEIPAAPDVAALLQNYQGKAAVSSGEAFDPTPVNIEARLQRSVLTSGAKVALLPKDTRGDTVQGRIALHFGDEASLRNQGIVPDLVGEMLMRGSADMSRQQLADALDQLKATVTVSGTATGADVDLLTTREHLPALMDLLAKVLRQPSFPAGEFEQLRTQMITGLESQRSEPTAVAGNALMRHFDATPADHPRHVRTFEESIEATRTATLDRVRSFHSSFYGADHAEFAFVGDFDAGALKAQLNSLFGDWKGKGGYTRITSPYRPVAARAEKLELPDKPNAMLLMQTELPLSEDDPDYAAMMVANLILGGDPLKSRIADRVRQQEGLTYAAGSQFNAAILDERATLVAYAIMAPQNVATVETSIREEVARMLKDGVSDAEVREAVSGLLKKRQTERSDDAVLSTMLKNQAYYGFTLQRTTDFEKALSGLTGEAVTAALRRNLKPETLSVFTAGSFAGAK